MVSWIQERFLLIRARGRPYCFRSSFIRTLRFAYWRELLCEHATEEDQLAHARTLAS